MLTNNMSFCNTLNPQNDETSPFKARSSDVYFSCWSSDKECRKVGEIVVFYLATQEEYFSLEDFDKAEHHFILYFEKLIFAQFLASYYL